MCEAPPPQRSVIVLVRHGHTAWSGLGRFAGHADVPLCPEGRREAEACAERLVSHLACYRSVAPAVVLTSDLSRAADTAGAIGRALVGDVVVDAALREESLGPWEGLTHAQVARRFPQEYEQWRRGRSDAFGGREGLDSVANRATAAVSRAAMHAGAGASGRPLVVVTHVNTALALVGRLCGLDRRVWIGLDALPPAGAVILERERPQRYWTMGLRLDCQVA